MSAEPFVLQDALDLDARDELAHFSARFELADDLVYLDGNSLGALPRATPARIVEVVRAEWGDDLISSWNKHGWISLPMRVGAKLARLLGAYPDEVIAADSTTVNLFKIVSAAVVLRPGRTIIVSEQRNFGTDLYVVEGLARLLGGKHELRLVNGAAGVAAALAEAGPRVAALVLTHVCYRTGRMLDMAGLTRLAHQQGALAVWDLAHSAGAVPVDLNAAGADFAVGCGYKFLNGGPGAPAFLFAARRHLEAPESARCALQGWLGHARPFAFETAYEAAPGVRRFQVGTPPILSLAALEVGVDIALEAPMEAVRAKSLALGELLIRLIGERCPADHGLQLVSPRDTAQRGSQLCFSHPEAYGIVQALIARRVVGDFRAPNILRLGLTPLYTRFRHMWAAAEALAAVLRDDELQRPEYRTRAAVT
ncbi:hypothetical protein WJX81_000510 [Elliptochloris bilobata]|uniref:Kynureninase n=1 Tax=Elliptochloris bilobata TaxID=381761 RepID=A0AAW1QZC4_9CHLO